MRTARRAQAPLGVAAVNLARSPHGDEDAVELATDLREMDPGRWHRGALWLLLIAALLPIAGVGFLSYSVLGGILLAVVRRKDDDALGRPWSLSGEVLAALIVIPLCTLIASVGASVAFDLWREPADGKSWLGGTNHADALNVVFFTIILPTEIVILWIVTIARHRGGTAPLPFESDVDPRRGIAKLREWRTARVSGFIAGRELFAEDRVNDTLLYGANDPNLVDALRGVWRRPRDRYQLVVLVSAAVVWSVAVGVIEGVVPRLVYWNAGSIAAVVLFGGVDALMKYRTRLRWARREQALHQVENAAEAARPLRVADLAQISEDVRALRREVNEALALIGDRSPYRSRTEALGAVFRRAAAALRRCHRS